MKKVISLIIIILLIFVACDKNGIDENLNSEINSSENSISSNNSENISSEINSSISSVAVSSNTISSKNDSSIVKNNSSITSSVPVIVNNNYTLAKLSQGKDIWTPSGSWGYRYGPTMIRNSSNSIDLWYVGEGNSSSEWDWIRYRHSDDNGKTWTAEKIVLRPTPGSEDAYSCCDPGVIKIGNYYYIGYTSTMNKDGILNNIYVARSKTPDGPFTEKWNGNGWGDKPKAIIYYDGDQKGWGAGEITFVEKNGTLYMYYAWLTPIAWETRLATAVATDENWPSTIQVYGKLFTRHNPVEDTMDVKYANDIGKFIAVSTGVKWSAENYVVIRESIDGINFKITGKIKVSENFLPFSHSLGITGTANGHMTSNGDNYLSYCHGSTWGKWSLYFQPIKFYEENK